MLRRSLVVLVALCLVVPVAAPAIAPASGGDAPTATTAKKKCKKGYKRVKGKCKKKKKKSSGNTYKGTPPEITVSVSGSTVTFKWSLSKCSATGLPASITEQTPLDKSNPARSQFRINKPLGSKQPESARPVRGADDHPRHGDDLRAGRPPALLDQPHVEEVALSR